MADDTDTSSSSKISQENAVIKAIGEADTLQKLGELYAKSYPRQVGTNSYTLRIQILEEPLTAQNLATIIVATTDLHARCWLIQQNRVADLMDYVQARDPRFLKEANLKVGIMTHNSPALIDFIMGPAGIAGVATLAFALKKGIDAVIQTPLRFRAMRLINDREVLNQQIAAQQAEARNKENEQEWKLALQKSQIELEKQQLELDRLRLELQKDRVKIALEIATTTVSQLQSDMDTGQREIIIHALVPPLLQLAATDGLMTILPRMPPNDENKETSENK